MANTDTNQNINNIKSFKSTAIGTQVAGIFKKNF